MPKRYVVRLTDEERQQLQQLVKKGKAAAYKIKHANILLKVDAAGDAWTDQQAAQAFGCHVKTVRNVRQRLVLQGLDAALGRKKQDRLSRQPVCDGQAEARLIALACGAPPDGYSRWTLRLLADRMVELNIVASISHECVRTTLQKTNSSRTCANAG